MHWPSRPTTASSTRVAFVEDGRVYLATPDCADSADRDDAVDHGGEPQDDEAMTHNCLFQTGTPLVAALSAFAGHAVFGDPTKDINSLGSHGASA